MRTEIGERLKEERERLQLSQVDFATLGGASKRSIVEWEGGRTAVNSEFLATMAAHGLDLMYVLTGTRSIQVEPTLSADEAALLDNYRHSAPEDKAAIRKIGSSFAEHKGGGECDGGKTRAQRRGGNES